MITNTEKVQEQVTRIVDNEAPLNGSALTVGILSERNGAAVSSLLTGLQRHSSYLRRLHLTQSLTHANFIILHILNEDWGWKALHAIRRRTNHFLKPILLLHEQEAGHLNRVVDAAIPWPPSQTLLTEALQNQFAKIQERIASLPPMPESVGVSGARRIQLLRYLYVRSECAFEPVLDMGARAGYTYPIVRMLFSSAPGVELEQLEQLHDSQLLTTQLVDRVNVCPECQHSHLNFRELCPSCNALDISEEATIHHFRCSYVGRESEFGRDSQLICPKCQYELRHIGVDYDKPAEIIWCNDCGHNFSDPRLSCFCLACAATFAPEDAVVKGINIYALSQEGHHAALEGAIPGHGLISILKKELGFYKNEVFIDYLRVEIARCRRYRVPSTLSKFDLKAVHESLDGSISIQSRQFRKTFAEVLRQTYRKTDLLTDLPNGDILIIFANTTPEQTKIAYRRLAEGLQKAFGVHIKLRFSLYDLLKVSSPEALIERLRNGQPGY